MAKKISPSRKGKSYTIGYGRPPKKYQFKPGQSGHPSGRPKRPADIPELIARELKRKRVVTIGGKRVSIRVDELLVRSMITAAAQGSRSAFKLLNELAAPVLEKARNKGTYTKVHPKMTPLEAAAAFRSTMVHDVNDDYYNE